MKQRNSESFSARGHNQHNKTITFETDFWVFLYHCNKKENLLPTIRLPYNSMDLQMVVRSKITQISLSSFPCKITTSDIICLHNKINQHCHP